MPIDLTLARENASRLAELSDITRDLASDNGYRCVAHTRDPERVEYIDPLTGDRLSESEMVGRVRRETREVTRLLTRDQGGQGQDHAGDQSGGGDRAHTHLHVTGTPVVQSP